MKVMVFVTTTYIHGSFCCMTVAFQQVGSFCHSTNAQVQIVSKIYTLVNVPLSIVIIGYGATTNLVKDIPCQRVSYTTTTMHFARRENLFQSTWPALERYSNFLQSVIIYVHHSELCLCLFVRINVMHSDLRICEDVHVITSLCMLFAGGEAYVPSSKNSKAGIEGTVKVPLLWHQS